VYRVAMTRPCLRHGKVAGTKSVKCGGSGVMAGLKAWPDQSLPCCSQKRQAMPEIFPRMAAWRLRIG